MMTTEPTNDNRADRAAVCVGTYREVNTDDIHEDDHTTLSDMLTDLRHWAQRLGLDYEAADLLADAHWAGETDGK